MNNHYSDPNRISNELCNVVKMWGKIKDDSILNNITQNQIWNQVEILKQAKWYMIESN